MGLGLDGVVTYTPEELVARLQELAQTLGRTPGAVDIRDARSFPSHGVFKRRFGSLQGAWAAAGLEPPSRKVQWTESEIVAALQEAARELGRAPRAVELSGRPEAPDRGTIARRFDSYAAALVAAGLEPAKRRGSKDAVPEQALLDELRRVAKLAPSPLSQKAYAALRPAFSPKRLIRRFGRWSQALEAAGLPARRRGPVGSRKDLAEAVRELGRRVGRVPKAGDLSRFEDLPPFTAFQTRFGTWREALLAAGYEPGELKYPVARLSDDQLLAALRELERRLGRTPDRGVAAYVDGFPSPSLYRQRFGGWNAALLAAGLPVVRRQRKAKDGHLCDSAQEAQVDNFLCQHGIAHSVHPLYPPHPELNPRQSLIADWRLEADGTLVEHFGLPQKDWYRAKAERKRALAAATGVRLIEVTPEDLSTPRLRELFGSYLGAARSRLSPTSDPPP